MLKKVMAVLAITMVFIAPTSAMAEETKSRAELSILESAVDAPEPTYIIKWDYEQETGAEINKKIIFSDGSMDELTDDYIMLMIDGNFNQNSVIISDSIALLPIGIIAENQGAEINWDNVSKTASFVFPNGMSASVQAGSNVALLNSEEVVLETPAEIVGDRIYVITAFVAEILGVSCDVYQRNETFAKYPIVILNSAIEGVAETKEAAEEGARDEINGLFTEFAKKYGEYEGEKVDLGEDAIKELIGNPMVSGEISRYWIMSNANGEDFMLRDKYNGNLFVFRGNYASYWVESLTVDSLYYVFFTE